jgi:hypothetical protein
LSSNIKGYHSQLHFKCNELELFFNFDVISLNDKIFGKCHQIEKLVCSRARELSPNECITERKCELYHNKDTLFSELGIVGDELTKLDQSLRTK